MQKVILTVCCILFLGAAYGQNSVVVSEQSVHGKIKESLIREYKYPSTISCVFTESDESVFIYADQNMQTKEFEVPNLKVNDMIVHAGSVNGRDDTVFFCGENLATGFATFGYFNVYDAFNGSGPVYLHAPFMSGEGSYNVVKLTRMESFQEGLNNHYVCVGTDEHNYPSIVEVIFGPSNAIVNYRTATLDYNEETIFDIKRASNWADNYLVTAGMDYTLNGRYLNLRVYDINDIFDPTGIQNMKHVFCIDTAFGVPWDRDDVLIRSFDDGLFSTVSYLDESLYNHVVFGTRPVHLPNSVHIGVFKVANLVSNSVSSMIGSTVFEPLALVHNSLKEYINSPVRTFSFLERILDGSGNETSTYCEVELNTSWNVNVVRKFNTGNDIYCGMDVYDNQQKYVMSGFEDGNRTMMKYSMKLFHTTKSCHITDNYSYIHYNPYRSVNREKKFKVKSAKSNFSEVEVEQMMVPQTIICHY